MVGSNKWRCLPQHTYSHHCRRFECWFATSFTRFGISPGHSTISKLTVGFLIFNIFGVGSSHILHKYAYSWGEVRHYPFASLLLMQLPTLIPQYFLINLKRFLSGQTATLTPIDARNFTLLTESL